MVTKFDKQFERLFFFRRASKGEYTFLAAVYACDVGAEFENPQYNRLYCSSETWIHSNVYPTCISTGETDGKLASRINLFVAIILRIESYRNVPHIRRKRENMNDTN